MEFFASAAKGTEGMLRDELRELRIPRVRADRGGVHFEGDIDVGWKACLWSRIAMRVLLKLSEFDAPTPKALYDGVRAVAWSEFLTPRNTLAVTAHCRSSALTHSQFVGQKTKDAVVDQFRDASGARPSVNVSDPDVGIYVHIVRDRAQLYVDLAGDALHRRGYRTRTAEAPIKENLAAAILRFVGWDKTRPLIDPMCGSGTFAIEAALWAGNIAPGLVRQRFGFQRWATYDADAAERFERLCTSARALSGVHPGPITASDIDPKAIEATQVNARAAGVSVTTITRSLDAITASTPPALVVTNPPYGERLATDDAFDTRMVRTLSTLSGHTVAILSGNPKLGRLIRPTPKEHTLFNGAIDCRLFVWDVP